MLPLELRIILDEHYAAIILNERKKRFILYPELEAIINDFSDKDIVRQAAIQYLAHHQCIISNVLLGISLCTSSTAKSSITSSTASEQYLCSGIRTLYKYHKKIDFSWLTEKHKQLWQHCCHTFLLYEYKSCIYDDELVCYVESQCNQSIFDRKTG